MRTLHTTAKEWLSVIPESLTILKRTTDNIKDPLFRFFEREVCFLGTGGLVELRLVLVSKNEEHSISECLRIVKFFFPILFI